MSLFEVKSYDREVYEKELKDFLPQKILDVHTHVYLKEFFPPKPLAPGEVKPTVTWPSLVAADDSIEDLQETYRLMLPGRTSPPSCSPTPAAASRPTTTWPTPPAGPASRRCISARRRNPRKRWAADPQGRLPRDQGISESFPQVYPEAEIRIFDFFPKAQLKKMDEMGAIVMLHIPRNGRLKDPVNLAQIMEIKQEFLNIRLIIAHIGRAYTKEDVGNAFENARPGARISCDDFCANCCEYAITEVIRHAGVKHVMYGTDMPILHAHPPHRGKRHLHQPRSPGLYGDPKQDKHLREVSAEEAEKITFFLYEELLAFKRAAKTLGLSRQDIEDIMYNNAHDLIEGARKSIYG